MVFFDESYLPVVYIVSSGEYAEADIQAYYTHFRSFLRRRERFATISESRHVAIPSAYMRKRIAEMADDLEVMLGGLNFGSAAVLSSGIMVGAARAVQWLRQRAETTYFSTTMIDAYDYVHRLCDEQGLVVPAGARGVAVDLDRI